MEFLEILKAKSDNLTEIEFNQYKNLQLSNL